MSIAQIVKPSSKNSRSGFLEVRVEGCCSVCVEVKEVQGHVLPAMFTQSDPGDP